TERIVRIIREFSVYPVLDHTWIGSRVGAIHTLRYRAPVKGDSPLVGRASLLWRPGAQPCRWRKNELVVWELDSFRGIRLCERRFRARCGDLCDFVTMDPCRLDRALR